MRKTALIFFPLFLILLTGCNDVKKDNSTITEEDAKQIVIDKRTRECCGEAKIVSISSKADKYIIQWEIESIEELGKESIDKQTGKMKMIESSRRACKIK